MAYLRNLIGHGGLINPATFPNDGPRIPRFRPLAHLARHLPQFLPIRPIPITSEAAFFKKCMTKLAVPQRIRKMKYNKVISGHV